MLVRLVGLQLARSRGSEASASSWRDDQGRHHPLERARRRAVHAAAHPPVSPFAGEAAQYLVDQSKAREAGSDVLHRMVWIPFVTFWQVSADLPFSTGVPGGHGDKHTTEYVDGWNAVLRPTGFSGQQLADIRGVISTVE